MEKAGCIEYKMPEVMAKAYLKGRKGSESKKQTQEFLCKVVNENYGLKGKCVKVILY